jgi:hypothetical protein
MLCILKTAVAWVVLMFLATNLIGFVVRGFFPPKLPAEGPTDRVTALLQSEARRLNAANLVMTLLGLAALVALLYGLAYYWNVYLSLAAGLLMVARLPDLLWEIKIGQPVTKENAPRGVIYYAATSLIWLAIPLIWYSLCYVPFQGE